eukprot:TRINITY_DN1435_c0_g1_i1.p1 TRINITY_DN1435_c0_g1~~TRINITY_DN1435_c0_g1_i1.p1  ORF type:complete len:432 (+),score=121.64 TRINITY_DN1435_c0_g1_i1:32-1297(+)
MQNTSKLTKDELEELLGYYEQFFGQIPNYAVNQELFQKYLRTKGKRTKNINNSNFDWTKYRKRHIALRFFYLGEKFQGFASQPNIPSTVENVLLESLITTCLIPSKDYSDIHFSRCGRTDKFVSAFDQVVALYVRTNLKNGLGVINPDLDEPNGNEQDEIDFCGRLNRVLPPWLQVYAWAPVDIGFSARFSCIGRTYRYFFNGNGLQINKMIEASEKLIGEHDFRNFCKMDVENVTHFDRTLYNFNIEQVNNDLFQAIIVGNSFLYRQVRCMMGILFLIGKGDEDSSIIEELLDVEKNPRKPMYDAASPYPLVLYKCHFEPDLLNWNIADASMKFLIDHINSCSDSLINSSYVWSSYLNDIHELKDVKIIESSKKMKQKKYVKLMQRKKELTYEERVSKTPKAREWIDNKDAKKSPDVKDE